MIGDSYDDLRHDCKVRAVGATDSDDVLHDCILEVGRRSFTDSNEMKNSFKRFFRVVSMQDMTDEMRRRYANH